MAKKKETTDLVPVKKVPAKRPKKIKPAGPKQDNTKIMNEIMFAPDILSDLVLKGDLRQFTPEQKAKYYTNLCRSLGLNPLTKPFDLIVLNNKEQLYANRNCAEQLRKINGISVIEITKDKQGDIFIITVKVQDKTGRYDIATGAVNLKGLSGDQLANKLMTAETKAKRRATLSICGLGMLDETEVATIPNVRYVNPEITDNTINNEAEAEQKAQAAQEALDKLHNFVDSNEYIKKAFEILGYEERAQYAFCNGNKWNPEQVKNHLNAIIDGKKQ